jgi:hypothetical protein
MDFKRKKVKGQSQKHRKMWLSTDRYRIVWRDECDGIAILARFQASVRIMLPDGREMWDFVSKRHLFKTFNAAKEACEKHYRLSMKNKR